MLARSLSLSALALLASLSNVEAFWRLPCAQPLIIERADPIVNPGGVSGHVHAVSGGSNFALSNTFENMRASECTSCLVKQDMSAYWTPQMYFQWANGSFTSVNQDGGGLIYYLLRYHSSDTTKIQAFPEGLRMLIGNPFLRSYSGSPMAQAIGWNCLGAPVAVARQPYLPPYNCPNGLRAELRLASPRSFFFPLVLTLLSSPVLSLTSILYLVMSFPSCWDGSNIDSADHISHMAYPEGDETGPCPSTHPIRIVTLFYEILWDVNSWKDLRSQGMNATQPFVLASGDPTGFSAHADFLDGWDNAVLQEAVDTCTDDSGVIQYCKVFDLYEEGHTCAKTPDVNEIVLGTLPSLPGCNPVTSGPANAVPCSAAAPVFTNTTVYTGKAPPPGSSTVGNAPSVLQSFGGYTYQDCYSDLVGGVRALSNDMSFANKTVEACLAACDAKGYIYCAIEYHGNECWASNTLGSQSTALGYGSCDLTCIDNPLQYCGGSNPTAMELYKRTGTIFSSASSSFAVSTASSSSSTSSTTSSSSASTASSTTYSSTSTTTSATSTTTSSTTTMTTTTTTSTTPATSSASSSLPSSTTVSASPSVSASASTKLTTSPDWTYSACYSDNVNGARSLPYSLSNPSATIEGCLAACRSAGYAVCAVEYGGSECYAGAALSSASAELTASKCSMSCNGDNTKTCGGPDALDAYLSTSVAVLAQPTTPNLATFGSWHYVNCYSDLINGARSLPQQLTNGNLTVEGCLNACTTNGAKVCALSYFGECFSSTTTISSASAIIPASRCGYPCKGNPREWCGGSAALSVYNLGSSTLSTRSLPSIAELRAAARLKQKRGKGLFKKDSVL